MRNHAQRVWVKSVVAVSCALIVFAQAALAQHKAGIEKHKADEQCEYCIAGVNLTGTGAAQADPLPARCEALTATPVAPVHTTHLTRAYHSRAPPVSSLSRA